jgi:hypothetical protein
MFRNRTIADLVDQTGDEILPDLINSPKTNWENRYIINATNHELAKKQKMNGIGLDCL